MAGAGTGTAVSGLASSGGIVTAPSFEPITLAELKLHLRLDSGSFSDNIDESQSLKTAAYAVAADYTTHLGTAVEVLGYLAVVMLSTGTLIGAGTLDVKIQESDAGTTWIDWTGGAFTQVTTANDNAVQEIEYTGTRRYIRTVAKVVTEIAQFETVVIRRSATTVEDDLLNAIIIAAREEAEHFTGRAIITQTWDYALSDFPADDHIWLPFGNLQSVSWIKYVDSDNTSTTMTLTTDYLVEKNGEWVGRIILPYSVSWPSFTPYTTRAVQIRFVCGWTTRALVPYKIKQAIKMIAADLYENREAQIVVSTVQTYSTNKTAERLLRSYIINDRFF